MRGFHFRFQPLLAARQALRDERRYELAEAQAAEGRAAQQLQAAGQA